MSADTPATLALLRSWHAGDAGAFQALIARHLPAIRERVSRRMGAKLRARAESGDLVQDVLVRVLREAPRFHVADDEHFRMLLARIVENVIRDEHKAQTRGKRSAAREEPLPDSTVLHVSPASQQTPSRIVDRREREAWVRFAISLLPPLSRDAIVLHDWHGKTFAEIGEALSIAEDAARFRYQRALAKVTRTIGALRRGSIEAAIAFNEEAE
ncbi:MAG TPA: sigma-70 family RNA polymerase sigma factor [Planctomycetota bacterium]|nr:sigma-70 family RNA polymerase sigma factor [Planctomycetota bacterium]